MPNFAANVSTMFTEYEMLERIQVAADCGFRAVECQFPYATPADQLAQVLDETDVRLVLLNAPLGHAAAGDRGLGAVEGREEEFAQAVDLAYRYAETTGCSQIHLMAGCPTDGAATERFVHRLQWAADRVGPAGIDIMIEPMNRRDVPGYLLISSRQAERIIGATERNNVKLQFDTYHLQIEEGDLLASFERCFELTGHIQFSSLPGRHEPDGGEVDHFWLFDQFDRLGYTGWIGCEYRPRDSTLAGLGWAERYGIVAPQM